MSKKSKGTRKKQPAFTETSTAPRKALQGTVRSYLQHVLVCTDRKSKGCRKGGPAVLKAFRAAIKDHRLQRQVIVTAIDHVGGCSLGPNVIVYPEGVWYGLVDAADVEEIVRRHLIGGEVVARLARGTQGDTACSGCALGSPAQPLVKHLAA